MINVNKRKAAEDWDGDSGPTNNRRQPKPDNNNNNNIDQTVTTLLKTVKKWEKEFQIPIGYEQGCFKAELIKLHIKNFSK